MLPKTGLQWIKCILEMLILPIFGLVSFILNSISSFQNINSFKDRPTYVYSTKPFKPKDDHVYVLSDSNCSAEFSQDLVDFVNDLKTGYYVFMFVFCFIFCICCFLGSNFVRVSKYLTDKTEGLAKVNLVSTVLSYLSFVFSVPCVYATKVDYDKCIKYEGILSGYMNNSMMLFCNLGMWALLVVVAYCWARRNEKVRQFEKNPLFKVVLVVMALYIFMFLVMALVVKFGSLLEFQLGWDISLCIDLTSGCVGLKYNDWNVGKVQAFS